MPLVAVLAVALVLRAPITVVPPLLPQIRGDLGLSAPAAGLLTSIPVLCFGLLTPLASTLLRRLGINHAVIYTLVAVIAGSCLRSAGSVAAALAGTAVLGAGIAIGNLAVPMIIGRQFRHRAALVTGIYTATTNVAVTASTALAVPAAALVGWRWAAALGGVAVGALGLVLWIAVYRPGVRGPRDWVARRARVHRRTGPVEEGGGPSRPSRALARWPFAWLLAIAFSGHTLAYYTVTAWLPSALVALRDMTDLAAGAAASVFQAAGVLGPMLVPFMRGRLGWSPRLTLMLVGIGWAVLPVGMLVSPAGWAAWVAVAGVAQGAFFVGLLSLIIERAHDVHENRRLSAFVQTAGYCVAASGPVVTGWVHQAFEGWDVPFAFVLGAVMVMAAAAIAAARDVAGESGLIERRARPWSRRGALR